MAEKAIALMHAEAVALVDGSAMAVMKERVLLVDLRAKSSKNWRLKLVWKVFRLLLLQGWTHMKQLKPLMEGVEAIFSV